MAELRIPAELADSAALRVMARCDALAEISATPGELTRVYLSPEHLRANQRVGDWMRAVGMRVWQDEVGNLCGRYEGLQPELPAILLGSHLDTVRNAGRYDGMLGVLTAIEAVHYLHQHRLRLPMAIEVIGFADEEGTRFGIALLGSRGIAGTWPADWLERRDAGGISVGQALRQAGLDPKHIGRAKRDKAAFSAYLELHIEQGPILENAGLALGVVSAINGARRLNCRFDGEAGHAGTVPMAHRKDALNTAARWMARVNGIVAAHGPDMVATVGSLQCLPGAVNVIPGEVRLTLDVRGPDDRALAALLTSLLGCADDIAGQHDCVFSAEEFYRIDATPCDERLRSLLAHSVRKVQGASPVLTSGAGHDAIALAPCWPVGMLFVRCDRGISHHPDEAVTTPDVAAAIRAYLEAVLALAQAQR
ncbi:allantoate amidohydrolase [Acerihabitans arboris]|uniref:Allantoate amidohydrolase n=1 Tax=Acerihabitans arboris TaxID=2691583 RepID=A0A845SMA3_9GAMM|nr:allantoate amidohydrolase [Acerihabitans arboris]NDL63751.1 allantoate amidohydrolase [Acerihabitans arboris]